MIRYFMHNQNKNENRAPPVLTDASWNLSPRGVTLAAAVIVYSNGVAVSTPVKVSGSGSPGRISCNPLVDGMKTGEYAVPPPNAYRPFGFVPKIVASLLSRISTPHLKLCAPRR